MKSRKRQNFLHRQKWMLRSIIHFIYFGSTGKPKGHCAFCAAYMVNVDYTFRNIFQCQEMIFIGVPQISGGLRDILFCLRPLLSGISSVMFEGIPTYPDAGNGGI